MKIADIINHLLTFDMTKDYDFEIKEYKEKRSLNANAYCWALITKIANVMRIGKNECYLKMLKEYGQSEIVSIKSEVDVKGYFKYYEAVGSSVLNDKEFTHYKVFKGSSEYDSKEMSIFIEGVVYEAKNLDIMTLDDIHLERLSKEWNNETKN